LHLLGFLYISFFPIFKDIYFYKYDLILIVRFIDPHVHLRDFNEKGKETVKHGLEVSKDSGVDAVFDMPNTDPPIIDRDRVLERLWLAKKADIPEVFYGLYVGLTSNVEQIKEAVGVYREFEQVVGMKLYAGHTTGNLGVIEMEDQERVYEALAKSGYDGVLAVHCEKENEMDYYLWDSSDPISHCHARSERSEIESVRDQIKFADRYGFSGKMHVCHISSPGAVELVVDAKEKGLDISSGICPHHFIYDWQQMSKDKGILWKMNPPLRDPESKNWMFCNLRNGLIDFIETDHAPHRLRDKIGRDAASGITGIEKWPLFLEYLRYFGFSDNRVEEVTFSKAAERYGVDVDRSNRDLVDRSEDYDFNFYEVIEKEIDYH
jgi:dihydroorotase